MLGMFMKIYEICIVLNFCRVCMFLVEKGIDVDYV